MNSSNHGKAITNELEHAEDVTHWRCRRTSASRGRGTSLAWGGTREWLIETLSRDAIQDRWGSGTYVIDFVRVNGDGSREPRGCSERLTFDGPPLPTAETFADPIAYALYVIRRVEHDRAALARRSLERERMQHMFDLK